MEINFLPTITTITPGAWRAKVAEIDQLGIVEVALFPTCLKKDERQELYAMLEKTNLESIPFVHARSDMSTDELDYLIKRWGTKVFNIHSPRQRVLEFDVTLCRDKIFIENTDTKDDLEIIWVEEEISQFAGICIDFSHLEAGRLMYPDRFEHNSQIIAKFKCGCAHISAIKSKLTYDPYTKIDRYDFHQFQDLNEFDYLAKYSRSYFPRYCALELENTLVQQLKARDYIIKLLK